VTFEHATSPAQLVGYLAFVLGVVTFAQKDDRRLKLLLVVQSLSYVVHFWMLGEPAASAAALVTALRALAAVKTRSGWVCSFFLLLGAALGARFVSTWFSVLPVIASSIGTLALFNLSGIRMRLALFAATLLWLVNNVMSGSIGGSILEASIAVANVYTMWRLFRAEGADDAVVEAPAETSAPGVGGRRAS
jgi:hypothetical protein